MTKYHQNQNLPPPSGNNFRAPTLIQPPYTQFGNHQSQTNALLPPSGNNFGVASFPPQQQFINQQNSSDRDQQCIRAYNEYQQRTNYQMQIIEASKNAAHFQLLQQHSLFVQQQQQDLIEQNSYFHNAHCQLLQQQSFVQQQYIDYLHQRMLQSTTTSQHMMTTAKHKKKRRQRKISENDNIMQSNKRRIILPPSKNVKYTDAVNLDTAHDNTNNKVQKEEETNATVHVLKDTGDNDDDDKDTPPPTPHDKTMILQYPFCFNEKMSNINNIETYMTENLLSMFPLDNDGENCNNTVSYDDTRTGGDVLNINEDTMNRLGDMRKSNAAVNKWLNDELVNLWMKW